MFAKQKKTELADNYYWSPPMAGLGPVRNPVLEHRVPVFLIWCVCFITAGPITKLFAWGEEESGGHVL